MDRREPSDEANLDLLYHRRLADGVLRRGPSADEIARIEQRMPGVRVVPVVRAGERLSDLRGQDSCSFELTDVVVGARDESELVDEYERVVADLPHGSD